MLSVYKQAIPVLQPAGMSWYSNSLRQPEIGSSSNLAVLFVSGSSSDSVSV